MYKNLPVYPENKCEYFHTFADYFTYTLQNPEHQMTPKYYRKGYFSTEHLYEDGLLINQVWKLKNVEYENIYNEIGILKTIDDLLFLTKKGWLECIHADVWNYSQLRDDKDNINWKEQVRANTRESLEFNVKVPSSIPDSEFDRLIKETANYILFEKYLKEVHEKKISKEKEHQ